MTRRDYSKLADAFRRDAVHLNPPTLGVPYTKMSRWQQGAYDQWNTTVSAVAEALQGENHMFDKHKFLAAAGVQ